MACLERLDRQEAQTHGDVDTKQNTGEPSLAQNQAADVICNQAMASRGEAIASVVDPTAELDLLDSLAKEAGIDIEAKDEKNVAG